MPAMKILTTLVTLPLVAAFAVLPAQDDAKQGGDKKKVEDSKITKNDAAVKEIDSFIKKNSVDKSASNWKTRLKSPPQQEFAADKDYLWHVETDAGDLTIRYLADEAPMHVTSGIYLSRLGFYDGLVFHRIIPGFMAQGACPLGMGSGGPGYYMDGEFKSGRKHDKPGLLSMANTGRPRSDGSQFFLTFVPTPWLDGKHTIWGEVVEGMDTVKALEKLGTRSGKVENPPKIKRTWIEVVEKKDADDEQKRGDKKDGDEKGADKNGG